MNSDHTKFIEGYCALYRQHFKEPYIFAGAKDGTAVKRLLAAKVPVDKALAVARESFSRSGYPWDMASSIAGLVSSWSIIVAALAKRPEPFKPSLGPSKFEIRQQIDITKMMIMKHPHNEESIFHNPEAQADIPLAELRQKLSELERKLLGYE